ncbi:scarecrow-like protein 21 [Rhodamnia argentea]|uniref:Scarecrow-like protein 21 n=1 Tax=Rhodamnia argentea TaxID=178133 RepID=A0A8B8NL69_9MYRT|nr:scarecrow-like protein 21 [Rhodamnia argentea]XP_030523249.1 scarecrow-like protein 21 [Rhodamnia argentea]XP_030523258.1 scarecrow-like protein 21 [Rhodamnia argentea]XP_030523267.1 scarecrow-like protein 21 [Rhodamnia argentea]XP_030523276.1 scarecrow-like protein 21 [Rhodamnia argentea]XP_048129778.1 scarecrow-like protein 21 [Rhodamnia argentea]
MQASYKPGSWDASDRFYNLPAKELESSHWSSITNLDHLSCSDESSQGNCTLESSSGSAPHHVNDSPSAVRFSPDESPTSKRASVPDSCAQDHLNDLELKVRELETVMLGPSSDMPHTGDVNFLVGPGQMSQETETWNELMEIISRRDLKKILCACAKAIEDNDTFRFEWLVSELRPMVSVSGDPIQRLSAYMLEGLIARLAGSGSSIYKALKCKEPASAELLSYMHILYEICPYFKFGYVSANGAIAEAMKDENIIHIIDFQIAQGSQWITLIQALAARPGGPPCIRITGIDDSGSAYARGGGLEIVGQRLSRLAKACRVPFQFYACGVPASDVEIGHLPIQAGEAIAVNFPLMLHHIPDESVCSQNHRDRLIRMAKSLSPKVVTLVEQESNTNTAPFFSRFLETLNYYLAIFESIDMALPREQKERVNVEQHCLARDIVNLIACEGLERVERHELLGKWRLRFVMAGFSPYPLSSFVNATIRSLLSSYCDKYTLEERDGALYLGWMNRHLVASCAWEVTDI